MDMGSLCDDLAAEQTVVDELVAPLDEAEWGTPTPAEGWTVRHQIGHLAYFDEAATTAAVDPARFESDRDAMMRSEGAVDAIASAEAARTGIETLAWWRDARRSFIEVFRDTDPKRRIPWYGPPMSAASKVTARLMETWAHGQDIADALSSTRPATDRLRHVAHIGVGARPFSYLAHRLEPPAAPVRVELVAPSGQLWTWGPEDAADVVRGSALDFCLLITQRRHRDDTGLEAVGPLADEWLSIGQAFAGPPGAGRQPGQFSRQ